MFKSNKLPPPLPAPPRKSAATDAEIADMAGMAAKLSAPVAVVQSSGPEDAVVSVAGAPTQTQVSGVVVDYPVVGEPQGVTDGPYGHVTPADPVVSPAPLFNSSEVVSDLIAADLKFRDDVIAQVSMPVVYTFDNEIEAERCIAIVESIYAPGYVGRKYRVEHLEPLKIRVSL